MPWSFDFYFFSLPRNRGQCPAAFWGKPSASYLKYPSRAQPFSAARQLSSCWKAATAPAASAAPSRSEQHLAGAIPAEAGGTPEEGSPNSSPRPAKTQRNQAVLSGHFANLLSWVGRWGSRWLLPASCRSGYGAAALWWSAVLLPRLTKGIHSLNSSPAVLLASESLLSVTRILFTSLISSHHQLMNKLFISKFINYSTSSIDDWIILTK